MSGEPATPTTYEDYAASRSDARFTDWLRTAAEPTWSEAVEHPFVHALGNGTLDEEAFAVYLIQDYAFMADLVGAFGRAIGDAPTIAAKRRFVAFLDSVTDEENDYFERAFDALEIDSEQRTDPELAPVTAAFLDLLGRASREGGYAETLAVLVPAEWIYQEWATAVAAAHDIEALPFSYAEWIELHAIPDFIDFVEWLRQELDRVGRTLEARRRRRVHRLFGRTVELEVAFFDHPLPGGGTR